MIARMRYRDGKKIALGDVIKHADSPGTVVGFPTAEGFPSTCVGFEWTAQSGRGLWVRFSTGAIVHLDDVDEDLEFVARAGQL